MKQIERLISIKYDTDLGELYVFGNRHREEYQTFLSLDMAREARRKFDQRKKWWSKVGIHDEYLWTKWSQSRIERCPESGYYYVSMYLDDDILVSDLFPKARCHQIQKYLDDHKWSKQALNSLKKSGADCTTKYYGILPTRDGYLIRDYENNQHGLFEKLEDAVTERDNLLKQGVVI